MKEKELPEIYPLDKVNCLDAEAILDGIEETSAKMRTVPTAKSDGTELELDLDTLVDSNGKEYEWE